MTTRTLPAALESATVAAALSPVYLLELEFDSGTVGFWTGYGELVIEGTSFLGTGIYGGASAIEETAEMKAVGAVFSLSGIPSSLIAAALAEDYQGRPARLYFDALDSSGVLVADPVQVFAGRMDVMDFTDAGDTASIEVSVESALADLEEPREWRFTHQEQQALFPDDLGLEFVPALQGKQLVWEKR